MRIGIVPDIDPSGPSGGVYQYSMTMLHAFSEWKRKACDDEFIVFAEEVAHPTLQ